MPGERQIPTSRIRNATSPTWVTPPSTSGRTPSGSSGDTRSGSTAQCTNVRSSQAWRKTVLCTGRGDVGVNGSGSIPSCVACPAVRLVVARCSVDYVGRLTAHLPMAPRLLLVKADGSVSIHADDRAYKPLNWMSPPCWLEEQPGVWTVRNKADESLVITIDEVLHDSSHELGVDPGLVEDGVEAPPQESLAAPPETFGEGWTLVRREFMTAIGPVDLLCRDTAGGHVAVEIKRRGDIDGVEHLTRYLEPISRDRLLAPVRGVFPAGELKPKP